MTDFALLSIFALVPLVLRWITTWQIGRFRAAACKSDGEYRELAGQLSQVREANCDVERLVEACPARELVFADAREAVAHLLASEVQR